MADCTDYPTPEDVKRFKNNAGSVDEFVTSPNDTFTDQDGNTHHTMTGIRNSSNVEALSGNGGAALVGTSQGSTVQAHIDSANSKNVEQDARLNANDASINNINQTNVTQDGRLTTNEASINNINQTNVTQDGRLTTNEANISALQSGQGSSVFGYATKALMDADLTPPDNAIAYVTNDATATNNGTYRKSGASGTGSWVQSSSDLASQAYQLGASADSKLRYSYLVPIVPSNMELPVWDSLNQTLTFRANTIFRLSHGDIYRLPFVTTVDLTLDYTFPWMCNVYINQTSKVFSVTGYDEAAPDDSSLVAMVRGVADDDSTVVALVMSCEYEHINKSAVTRAMDSLAAISYPLSGKLNLDTQNRTLTIPDNSLTIEINADALVLPSGTVEIPEISSLSRVYFNAESNTYLVTDNTRLAAESISNKLYLIAIVRILSATEGGLITTTPYTLNSIDGDGRRVHGSFLAALSPPFGDFMNLNTGTRELHIPDNSITITTAEYPTLVLPTATILLDTASSIHRIYFNVSSLEYRAIKGGDNPNLVTGDYLIAIVRMGGNNEDSIATNTSYTIDYNVVSNAPVMQLKDSLLKGIAHRGYSITHPENTLTAMKEARRQGFSWIEADHQITSDGVWMLMHDYTVDRTTDGTGVFKSMTKAQIDVLDAGSWKGAAFAGEKVPTTESMLLLCKSLDMMCNVEIKTLHTQAQVEQLVDLVSKCGMKGNVMYAAFDIENLQFVKNYDPSAHLVKAGNLDSAHIAEGVSLQTTDNLVYLSTGATDGVNPTLTNIGLAHASGCKVIGYTLNRDSQVRAVAERGIDAILTDKINITQSVETGHGINR